MTDDVRQAAERVVAIAAGLPAGLTNHWLLDAALVAKAWLAEHPADDGEPVTEAWLLSMGFIRRRDPADGRECHNSGPLWYSDTRWFHHEHELPTDGTRGAVRALCRAIGHPLQETP